MKKTFFSTCCITLLFFSCGVRNLKFENISRITAYTRDSIQIASVTDPEKINKFLDKCLARSRRRPLKFSNHLTIGLSGKDSTIKLIVNGDAFVLNTYPYQCECDIEKYVAENFK